MLAAGAGSLLFYQPELFVLLGNWLQMVARAGESGGTDLLGAAGDISTHLQTFLTTAGFAATWDNLKRHNPGVGRRVAAFHGWFDAFRTMRLLHHLTDAAYPRIPPEQAVAPLLVQAGHNCPPVIADQLALLRRMQGADGITSTGLMVAS